MTIELLTTIISLITALLTALPLLRRFKRPRVWALSFAGITLLLVFVSYYARGYETHRVSLSGKVSPTIFAGSQDVGGAPRYTLNFHFELVDAGRKLNGVLSGRVYKNGGADYTDISKDSGTFEIEKFDSEWELLSILPPFLDKASISKIPDGAVSQFTTVHMKGGDNEVVQSWEVTGLASPSVKVNLKTTAAVELRRRVWLPFLWFNKLIK